MRILLVALAGLLITTACAPPDGGAPEPGPATSSEISDSSGALGFPAGAVADYQLGGPYQPSEGTKIVVRDSTAARAPGFYNICYVNGFQTQPGERDLWLSERRDLVLVGRDGRPMIDENWPDELIVDTSTAAKRARLTHIIGETINTCATKGFDAIEFDNLDSYSRSRGELTVADNLELATALASTAHAAGLLVGQKNAAELSEQGRRQARFDFAIAEECLSFHECDSYTAGYGERVIDIEYTDNLPGAPDAVCARDDRPRSTVIRDRRLVTPGTAGYFHRSC